MTLQICKLTMYMHSSAGMLSLFLVSFKMQSMPTSATSKARVKTRLCTYVYSDVPTGHWSLLLISPFVFSSASSVNGEKSDHIAQLERLPGTQQVQSSVRGSSSHVGFFRQSSHLTLTVPPCRRLSMHTMDVYILYSRRRGTTHTKNSRSLVGRLSCNQNIFAIFRRTTHVDY